MTFSEKKYRPDRERRQRPAGERRPGDGGESSALRAASRPSRDGQRPASPRPASFPHPSRPSPVSRPPRSAVPASGRELFLPMSPEDMEARGWKELDVLLVSGDAYVDHPSFGMALLGRWLESFGFRVGIVAQPRWDAPDDIVRMGRPRLFAGVTAGAVDSMLAHYTAFRKKRHDDAYTPGGQTGARPNRAVSVYTSLVRRAFPGLPVVAGGIEASLRRISHYDFWSDSLRKSLLPDAKLDVIVYGMGERALLDIARRLDSLASRVQGAPSRSEVAGALSGIAGTARMGRPDETFPGREVIRLPSHEEIQASPAHLVKATLMLERQVHQMRAVAVQAVGDRAVILEPPAPALTTEELDSLYALPFTRQAHPAYTEPIPAVEMMLTSMTCHRGCGGGCSFCSLALHQGRRIASRSRESLLREARTIADQPGFNGAVSDVGGPSANMWRAHCTLDPDHCKRASCMVPKVCPGFSVDQTEHVDLLREIRALPGIRHVRVASGVRFDLALRQDAALEAYAGEFTGGQLKVAPEHCAEDVLRLMRKPGMEPFERFLDAFRRYSLAHGKEQYVIPYLLSAFPGCTDAHMRQLADWLEERHWSPRQVQCFVPTPGTVATAMYYAEVDTEGRPLAVAKTDAARLRQHGILLGTARDRSDVPPRGRDGGRRKAAPGRMDRGGQMAESAEGRGGGQGRRHGEVRRSGRGR